MADLSLSFVSVGGHAGHDVGYSDIDALLNPATLPNVHTAYIDMTYTCVIELRVGYPVGNSLWDIRKIGRPVSDRIMRYQLK